MHLISTWTYPLPIYVWHTCILSPHGYIHHHHVGMVCMHLISSWTSPLPSCRYGMHASYLHMDIPTTITYLWYACNLSPHGYTHYHHVCMVRRHLISTWTYPLPSCMYGMHASYLHMDIPTTIMYVRHACILSPHGHTHYHHVCMVNMHHISTWTYIPPSCMWGMHASFVHMDIPTTIMYVWYACILSPHGHTHYHHVYMYGIHAAYLHMDIPTTIVYV